MAAFALSVAGSDLLGRTAGEAAAVLTCFAFATALVLFGAIVLAAVLDAVDFRAPAISEWGAAVQPTNAKANTAINNAFIQRPPHARLRNARAPTHNQFEIFFRCALLRVVAQLQSDNRYAF
jgi:hypothetical protein